MLPNSEKDFLKRHIGPSKEDQSKMLKELNYKSLDDLIDNTVPEKIKFKGELNIGDPNSEYEALRKLRAISKKNQVFSRIHVADITNAIIYLLQNKDSLKFYQIINIADDLPCSQIEVIQYCYDLLGLTMPNPILFEDVKDELSPIAQSFWMENRRVSNKLLCNTLGYKLIFKNYKVGLKNCFLNI